MVLILINNSEYCACFLAIARAAKTTFLVRSRKKFDLCCSHCRDWASSWRKRSQSVFVTYRNCWIWAHNYAYWTCLLFFQRVVLFNRRLIRIDRLLGEEKEFRVGWFICIIIKLLVDYDQFAGFLLFVLTLAAWLRSSLGYFIFYD